jgi:Arc/MetJ-type ribon-helix-helix transcriptional regulator
MPRPKPKPKRKAKGRDKVTIKIPRELYRRLTTLIEGTGFGSVTEFIIYVLRDLAAGGKLEQEAGLSPREVDLIRNRLKSLGYLE